MTIAFVVLGALGYLRLGEPACRTCIMLWLLSDPCPLLEIGLPFSAASAAVAGENFDMDKPVTALLNKARPLAADAGVLQHAVTNGCGCLSFLEATAARMIVPCSEACVMQDSWSIPMNAGVFAHCVLGYQLNLNTWADMVRRQLPTCTLARWLTYTLQQSAHIAQPAVTATFRMMKVLRGTQPADDAVVQER